MLFEVISFDTGWLLTSRYPELLSFFEDTLLAPFSTQALVPPGWFPVLTLLAKLKPAAVQEVPINLSRLVHAVIVVTTTCPIAHLRKLSATALPCLLPAALLLPTATDLLKTVHSVTARNTVHGTLLAALQLVREAADQTFQCQAWEDLLVTLVAQRELLADSCPVTRAAFLSLVCGCLLECPSALAVGILGKALLDCVTKQNVLDITTSLRPGAPDWPVACATGKLQLALRFAGNTIEVVVGEVLACGDSSAMAATANLLVDQMVAISENVRDSIACRCWTFIATTDANRHAEAWGAVAAIVSAFGVAPSHQLADTILPRLSMLLLSRNLRLREHALVLYGLVLPKLLHPGEHLGAWLAQLQACATDENPSTLRSALASSLLSAARSPSMRQVLSVENTVEIIKLLLFLLQSEEDDLRDIASEATAMLLVEQPSVHWPVSISPRTALSLCFHSLASLAISNVNLVVNTLLQLAVGPTFVSSDVSDDTLFAREAPNSYREALLTSQLALGAIIFLMSGQRCLIIPSTAVPTVVLHDAEVESVVDTAVRWGGVASAFLQANLRRATELGTACRMVTALTACVLVVSVLDPPVHACEEPPVFDRISSLGVSLEYLASDKHPPTLQLAAAMLRRVCRVNVPEPQEAAQQLTSLTVAIIRSVCGTLTDPIDSVDSHRTITQSAPRPDISLVFPETFNACWLTTLVPSLDFDFG